MPEFLSPRDLPGCPVACPTVGQDGKPVPTVRVGDCLPGFGVCGGRHRTEAGSLAAPCAPAGLPVASLP